MQVLYNNDYERDILSNTFKVPEVLDSLHQNVIVPLMSRVIEVPSFNFKDAGNMKNILELQTYAKTYNLNTDHLNLKGRAISPDEVMEDADLSLVVTTMLEDFSYQNNIKGYRSESSVDISQLFPTCYSKGERVRYAVPSNPLRKSLYGDGSDYEGCQIFLVSTNSINHASYNLARLTFSISGAVVPFFYKDRYYVAAVGYTLSQFTHTHYDIDNIAEVKRKDSEMDNIYRRKTIDAVVSYSKEARKDKAGVSQMMASIYHVRVSYHSSDMEVTCAKLVSAKNYTSDTQTDQGRLAAYICLRSALFRESIFETINNVFGMIKTGGDTKDLLKRDVEYASTWLLTANYSESIDVDREGLNEISRAMKPLMIGKAVLVTGRVCVLMTPISAMELMRRGKFDGKWVSEKLFVNLAIEDSQNTDIDEMLREMLAGSSEIVKTRTETVTTRTDLDKDGLWERNVGVFEPIVTLGNSDTKWEKDYHDPNTSYAQSRYKSLKSKVNTKQKGFRTNIKSPNYRSKKDMLKRGSPVSDKREEAPKARSANEVPKWFNKDTGDFEDQGSSS